MGRLALGAVYFIVVLSLRIVAHSLITFADSGTFRLQVSPWMFLSSSFVILVTAPLQFLSIKNKWIVVGTAASIVATLVVAVSSVIPYTDRGFTQSLAIAAVQWLAIGSSASLLTEATSGRLTPVGRKGG
jgi:hypothetical protein